MIEFIITFILVWIGATVIHEMSHYVIAWHQKAEPRIEFWLWLGIIPSMRCRYSKALTNKDTFLYGGGFGASLICLLLGALLYPVLCRVYISLFIVGIMQWVYGLYEGYYYPRLTIDEYMVWHYGAYLLGLIIGIILLYNEIISYIV